MAGQWFSRGTPVSFTNKKDCHDVTELLLKVAINAIASNPSPPLFTAERSLNDT